MSVLQFIASLKWPITILIGLILLTCAHKKNPEPGRSFARWLGSRNLRANIAGQEFEITAPDLSGVATTVTAPDTELAQAISISANIPPGAAGEAVVRFRRETVEELIRSAARWGWEIGQLGLPKPPTPQIDWEGERPVIQYGASDWNQLTREEQQAVVLRGLAERSAAGNTRPVVRWTA
ncbi:hypothetical protein [Actinacidiphila glaucinigra]|uniref:hypothetical protein n=1 Tax=Actinacidiphila glaucinigra TaxID=235986 RepID=UPI0035DC3DD8